MRRLTAAALAPVVLALVMLAGTVDANHHRPPPPDEQEYLRNSPPIVEQQAPGYWACYGTDPLRDVSDCVTNTGCTDPELIGLGCVPAPGCIWDPDDTVMASATDGGWSGCIWADWSGNAHGFLVTACRKPLHRRDAQPLYAAIMFNPMGPPDRPYAQVPPKILTGASQLSAQLECVRGCIRAPDWDRELDAEHFITVPLQGGGGQAHGRAVYTTVDVVSNGVLTIKMTLAGGTSGCEWP